MPQLISLQSGATEAVYQELESSNPDDATAMAKRVNPITYAYYNVVCQPDIH